MRVDGLVAASAVVAGPGDQLNEVLDMTAWTDASLPADRALPGNEVGFGP